MLKRFLLATTAIVLATGAMAQTKYPAVLEGHAVLPAMTLVPPPADAPEQLQISGRYAGPPGQRIDTPESVPSFRFLMPDRPCTGWPLSGRLSPVGRGAALSDRADMAGTLSGVSILWPGGPA